MTTTATAQPVTQPTTRRSLRDVVASMLGAPATDDTRTDDVTHLYKLTLRSFGGKQTAEYVLADGYEHAEASHTFVFLNSDGDQAYEVARSEVISIRDISDTRTAIGEFLALLGVVLDDDADYPDDLPHSGDARIVLTRFNGPGVRINCTADCRDGHQYTGGCALRRLDPTSCGASYISNVGEFTCTLTAGHGGRHWHDLAEFAWTDSDGTPSSDDLIEHAAASEPVGVDDEPRTVAVLTPMQPAAQQWPNGGTTGNDSPFAA